MADTDLAVQRLSELKDARRRARDGRLRHRLLVAELPQPLPGRHPQDGPLVPARRRDRRRPPAWPPRSSRSARRSQLEVVAEGIELPEQWNDAARPRAATSARASTSPGRWTPTRRSSSSHRDRPIAGHRPRRRLREPMQHSYEGLDRPGGVQPRAAALPAAPPGLPAAVGRDVRLADRRRHLPRRDGLAGLRAVQRARPRSRSSASR